MTTETAIEKLKVIKALIERLNSEMILLVNAAAEIEVMIKKNDSSERKYSLLERKIDMLIRNYKTA